ncbi:MAG: hypothetical protein WAM42_06430, partial [Candidatus Nitrosopolaris sp.]
MNLLYSIIFKPDSTFCAMNFENRSPSKVSIEENTIPAIPLLSESLIYFHLYPIFLLNRVPISIS